MNETAEERNAGKVAQTGKLIGEVRRKKACAGNAQVVTDVIINVRLSLYYCCAKGCVDVREEGAKRAQERLLKVHRRREIAFLLKHAANDDRR